jgi:osmotically-inducible protein OsmY
MLVAWTCSAQEPKGSTSGVGDKVDSAVQSLKKGAREAGDAIREQYNKMRLSVHNMGVSGRVYGRLHWDKALTDAPIEVDVRQDGVATITGTVPNVKAKVKAIELTRETVGVTQVIDRLTTRPTTAVTPAPATPAK